mmetsp:Transcript_85793/g.223886  ORF Transcript_85793/g.223886 Transcript_85793/m.223886 type:complete len:255 (-) Transcript_85793:341-1105(-)
MCVSSGSDTALLNAALVGEATPCWTFTEATFDPDFFRICSSMLAAQAALAAPNFRSPGASPHHSSRSGLRCSTAQFLSRTWPPGPCISWDMRPLELLREYLIDVVSSARIFLPGVLATSAASSRVAITLNLVSETTTSCCDFTPGALGGLLCSVSQLSQSLLKFVNLSRGSETTLSRPEPLGDAELGCTLAGPVPPPVRRRAIVSTTACTWAALAAPLFRSPAASPQCSRHSGALWRTIHVRSKRLPAGPKCSA